MKKLLWLGLIAAVALLGCDIMSRDFYRTSEDFPENGKGMLVLSLDGSDISTHTIAPSLDTMTPRSYVISGEHATDAFGPVTINNGVYAINDLLPGSWTIEVVAYNAVDGGGARIGSQTDSMTVEPNDTIYKTIYVQPDTGPIPETDPVAYYTGSLTLQISWVENTITTPVVSGTLVEGTEYTVGVSDISTLFGSPTTADSITSVSFSTPQDLRAGYYTLYIELYDDTEKIMGDRESVRIVSGIPTSGLFDLTGVPGEAEITITPDLNNPIVIDLDTSNLFTTRVVTATLQSPPAGSYFTYDWYEDGVLAEAWGATATTTTNDSYTVSTFTSGTSHNLSVVVTEYDGSDTSTATVITISSETHPFTEP